MTKHERYQKARNKLIKRAMKRADEEVGKVVNNNNAEGKADEWSRVYHREMNRMAFEKGLVGWR